LLQTEEVIFKSKVRVNGEGMRPEIGEPSFKYQMIRKIFNLNLGEA